jgi:Flp pilus assembly protein CpaB
MIPGRWMFIAVCLLAIAACKPGERRPVLLELEPLPTEVILPSLTPFPPTETPTFTPTTAPTVTSTLTLTPEPTQTPVEMVTLVVAVQPIPAGAVIPPEAVIVYDWPHAAAPMHAVAALDDAVGWVALANIACFEPLLENSVARRTVGSGYEPLPGNCGTVSALETGVTLIDVVIALERIRTGTIISPEMIALRPWPEALAPADAKTSLAGVIGSTARVDILREQPIFADKIIHAGN